MSSLQSVMLAEDDPDIAELARIAIEDFGGYKLTHFSSGEDALKGLQSSLPDIIILDYRMPGINGAEVLRQIKANTATQSIPVVFMTASVMPQHVNNLLTAGAAAVIAKPFDPLTLAERIEEVYEAHRR